MPNRDKTMDDIKNGKGLPQLSSAEGSNHQTGITTEQRAEKGITSSELEFAVFCIENVAAKLGVDAERVYQAFTEQSDILNGYIVPEYEVLHTQSREYIVDDLLDVMKERGVEV